MRPLWVEIGLAVIGCAVVILAVGAVANQYDSPATGDPTGIAYPVVILIGVTLVMSYLATAATLRALRLRFRRQPRSR